MDESEIKELENQLKNIYDLINNGKYQEALDLTNIIEKKYENNKSVKANISGFLIDIGAAKKDSSIVERGVKLGECILNKVTSQQRLGNIHYNLANGYFELFKLLEKGKYIEQMPQSENLQKAKLHFRIAINLCGEYGSEPKKRIWVNYGNCLDNLGRGVEALYAYDEALKIDKNFSMAIGNKAKALCFFADISGAHRKEIYIYSYKKINAIINNTDLIEHGGIAAKNGFEKILKQVESKFEKKEELNIDLKHNKVDFSKYSNFEKYYLEFCSKNKLFLNFHLHEELCEISLLDSIFIQIITGIKDNTTFYDLAKYINQIKEDYAVARLLLVQSQYRNEDFNNISKRTTFVNTLDYSTFNIYTGLLKSSFSIAYNILDKIAGFINDYYKIGMKEKRVYFSTIWKCDNCKRMRDKILDSKNIGLYALLDIHKDFEDEYYKKIKKIRNAITHRKLIIYEIIQNNNTKSSDVYVDNEIMLNETINLLQLVKSAIIYLINSVEIEERKKRKESNGLIAPMYVDTKQIL